MKCGFKPDLALLLVLAVITMSPIGPAPCAEEGQSPIEIEADGGIEWQENNRIVLARGNARAVRGDLEVRADTLTAHYRERSDGSTEVWQVDADGSVKITTPGQTAYADTGTYDMDQQLLILRGGHPLRVVTSNNQITADKEIRYLVRGQTLTAIGNATITEPRQRMQANEITIVFEKSGDGKSQARRIDANGSVQVVTPSEVILGDRSTYDLVTGQATITGSVRVTRGPNQLNGCRGEVDMRAGVSHLFGCEDKSGTRVRVHGLILPGAGANR